MSDDKKQEFGGSQNVWIKRLGLLILIIGLFPKLAITYWDKIELIGKWIIIFIIISYVLFHIKGFLKSIFKPKG